MCLYLCSYETRNPKVDQYKQAFNFMYATENKPYNGKNNIYKRHYMRSIFKYLETNDCASVYKTLVRCRETETIRKQ